MKKIYLGLLMAVLLMSSVMAIRTPIKSRVITARNVENFGTPLPEVVCRADVDGNGIINGIDRSIVVREWTSSKPNMIADVVADGSVDRLDFQAVSFYFGIYRGINITNRCDGRNSFENIEDTICRRADVYKEDNALIINGLDRSVVVREWTSRIPSMKADVIQDDEVNRLDLQAVVHYWITNPTCQQD